MPMVPKKLACLLDATIFLYLNRKITLCVAYMRYKWWIPWFFTPNTKKSDFLVDIEKNGYPVLLRSILFDYFHSVTWIISFFQLRLSFVLIYGLSVNWRWKTTKSHYVMVISWAESKIVTKIYRVLPIIPGLIFFFVMKTLVEPLLNLTEPLENHIRAYLRECGLIIERTRSLLSEYLAIPIIPLVLISSDNRTSTLLVWMLYK